MSNSNCASLRSASGLIRVGEAGEILGLSIQTVRKLCEDGTLETYRVGNGSHRRISKQSVIGYLHGDCLDSPTNTVLIYARTSSPKQKDDLKRQIERLTSYAEQNYKGSEIRLFSDNASTMNWTRPQLVKLLTEIMSGAHKGSTLLVSHPDRLGRHARPLIEMVCRHFEVLILYTEQDDEKSVETLMTEELLQIVHLYSIKMYSSRQAERRRKRLSAETIERGKILIDSGLSVVATANKLNAEGHRTEDGAKLTFTTVRKYIYLPSAQLSKVYVEAKNSAKEYVAEFVERGDKNLRTEIRKVHGHYESWCAETKREPVSRNKFGAHFRNFGHTWTKEGRCYIGLKIRGAEILSHTVREYGKKNEGETPAETFIRFINELGAFSGLSVEIYRRYEEFCAGQKISPLSHIHIGRLLRKNGQRPKRTEKGYFYQL